MAEIPLIAFQDGEALLSTDLEAADNLLRLKLHRELVHGPVSEYAWQMGDVLSGYLGLGNSRIALSNDANPYETTEALMIPRPAGALFDNAESKVFETYQLTLAAFFDDGDEEGSYFGIPAGTVLTAPSGTLPSVNPRWDTLELLLGAVEGENESRDVEDASTRVVTSQSIAKRRYLGVTSSAWKVGSEAALPDFPALTAGRQRFLSVRRTVGEGGSFSKSDFALHTYPMRLMVEDVHGYDAFFTSGWTVDINGRVNRTSTSAGNNLVFQPRMMHEGCRLLAVGVCGDVSASEPNIYLSRKAITNLGALSHTTIVNLGAGTLLSDGGGLRYAGERDWTIAAALAAGTNAGYPIWGNGRSYGPMFSYQNNVSAPIANERLCVEMSDTGTWDSADYIDFVRFVYAY